MSFPCKIYIKCSKITLVTTPGHIDLNNPSHLGVRIQPPAYFTGETTDKSYFLY